MSSLRNSKRQSSAKEDLSERSGFKEKEVPVFVSSPEDGEDGSASVGWECIGEEEERYLSSTKKELYELIEEKKTFGWKVKEKNSETLLELMRSLLTYSRDNVRRLQLEMEEELEGPIEQTKLGELSGLIFFQQRRIGWMYNEIRRRFLIEMMARVAKEARFNSLEEKNRTLRKRLEAVVSERGELLSIQDSRSVERKDVSTSTEAEVHEGERSGNLNLPPPVEIFQGLREALERIEDKVVETLSRIGVPTGGKTGGGETPDNGGGKAPQATNAWVEVVKRRRKRKPPILGGSVLTQKFSH